MVSSPNSPLPPINLLATPAPLAAPFPPPLRRRLLGLGQKGQRPPLGADCRPRQRQGLRAHPLQPPSCPAGRCGALRPQLSSHGRGGAEGPAGGGRGGLGHRLPAGARSAAWRSGGWRRRRCAAPRPRGRRNQQERVPIVCLRPPPGSPHQFLRRGRPARERKVWCSPRAGAPYSLGTL